MGYNPADYAAIENEAKEMSKQELEDNFVRKKNEKYTDPCAVVFMILFLLAMTFAIGYGVYIVGYTDAYTAIGKASTQIANEVCPIANDAYIKVDFKGTTFYDIEIDCQTYRVK